MQWKHTMDPLPADPVKERWTKRHTHNFNSITSRYLLMWTTSTHSHALSLSLSLTQTHTSARTDTHERTHTHAHRQTRTQTRTHAHRQTRTHTDRQTDTHTDRQTRTHLAVSAPLVMRVLMRSSWPCLAATWRGVLPYLSTQSISPPAQGGRTGEPWAKSTTPQQQQQHDTSAQPFQISSVYNSWSAVTIRSWDITPCMSS